LVSRKRGIQAGTAGADGRTGRSGALRRGNPRISRSEGGPAGHGRTQAFGLGAGGIGTPTQGCAGESENCLAVAPGNHDDTVMDCRATADGHQDASRPSAVLAWEEKAVLTILRTDPFTTLQ
jgi:hypothetical protein